MPATRDGKLWRSQFYYKDWQGVRRKKNKRGFKTKGEADEWERNFLQQQQKNLDISFENFVEIYFADMENRLRESTIINKRYVFDLKVTPYFKHKKMCEIQTSDIRAWQNELIKKGYAPTYLKSINNQLAALFNYAVRYYDLRDNPCRKAGSIGKSKADEMDFWTKQEFKEFLPSMDSKPEARDMTKKLGLLAEKYKCAIILIGHMNKAAGNKAAYRGMGSIDFFAVARSVLLVGRIEGQKNTRAVVQIKNNLAAFGHSKAFELTEEGFHWLGDYEITADELLGGITPKANKKERAKQLIYELAETNSVVKSEDIVNLAEEKGISKRTLENAKKELGIKGKRIGESWYWKLDEIVKP